MGALVWTALSSVVARGDGATPWYAVVEAEDMHLQGDWSVIKGQEGYFPSAPNGWSGNRIRGGLDATEAVATQEVDIPADGRYAVWVRYESPYGFDVHFDVTIRQGMRLLSGGNEVYSERFGDRFDLKYFNGTWRVQGPWRYHNTDYVYQKGAANLKKGRAVVTLSKDTTHPYMAARIVDLIYLTDDPDMEPGREMNAWYERSLDPKRLYHPAVMVRCTTPVYFRVKVSDEAERPSRVTLGYRFRPDGWRGPMRDLSFSTQGGLTERYAVENRSLVTQVEQGKAEFPPDELLPSGFDSGWVRYDLSTFRMANITVSAGTDAEILVARDDRGRDAETFRVKADVPRTLLVATGNSRLQDELFRGRIAGTAEIFAREISDALNAYEVPGKRPFKFGNLLTPPTSYEGARWTFFKAVGASGVYFQVPPDAYLPENAARLGVNRSTGYRALQNACIRKLEYYEGDEDAMRAVLERTRTSLEEDGVGDIPENFKMIEESGPKPLTVFRGSEIISDRFRDYLKAQNLRPADLLDRETLAEAVASGKTSDADLWPLVNFCDGTPQDAAENPVLFYHSKYFGSILFCDTCATAVRLIEDIFPKGSLANWGASFPQDGHGIRRRWYDEFMLFRRRGMTSYGSEMTWGLNGTPYYVGTETESYEGTIARGLAKYHDAPLGPVHLLACKRYGYPADYVELTVYALASHGMQSVDYYINFDFTGLDHYKAMKKAGYALGAIEDRIIGARVVPSKVALGWSETTAVWDQAVPPDNGYNPPGNTMYAIERHYLYLLLRHLQLPVDLLSDADIEEGRLKDYEVYFLVGDHITRKAAAALRGWVDKGGVLVSGAGGGLWDEYNQPLDTLKDVYGIKGARQYAEEKGMEYVPGQVYEVNENDNRLEKPATTLRAKLELVHAHPADTITYGERELPVLGYRQGLTVEEGQTLGTFKNGQAAIAMHEFGKGRAVIAGFLPGISYLYKAFPFKPYGRGGEDLSVYLYPDYKPLVREAMGELLKSAWPQMGASATTSHPYVEANLMEDGDGHYYVAVVNYSGKPIDKLNLRIRKADAGNPKGARAEFATVHVEDDGDVMQINMPIDKFDFITFARK